MADIQVANLLTADLQSCARTIHESGECHRSIPLFKALLLRIDLSTPDRALAHLALGSAIASAHHDKSLVSAESLEPIVQHFEAAVRVALEYADGEIAGSSHDAEFTRKYRNAWLDISKTAKHGREMLARRRAEESRIVEEGRSAGRSNCQETATNACHEFNNAGQPCADEKVEQNTYIPGHRLTLTLRSKAIGLPRGDRAHREQWPSEHNLAFRNRN